MMGRKLFLFIFLLLANLSTYPQDPAPNHSEAVLTFTTDLVVVDAQVLNKKTGRIVGGLKREDFLLYEDGIRQEIAHFSQDKLPLSIVLLLDLSRSVQPTIKQIREGALRALEHLKPEDEVALMAFATKTRLIQDFTPDRQLIADQISRVNETAHVGRTTMLSEAFYQAAIHLHRAANPGRRRVIIPITDDVSTQLIFIGHSEKEVLEKLFESGIVVYGLIVYRWEKIEKAMEYTPPRVLEKQLTRGSVKTYATKTGGEVMIAKKEEVDVKLAELIDHLRTRYSLGYVSSNTKQDGRFRKIKLRVTPELETQEGKLAVLTRQGYYARERERTDSHQQ